MVLMSVAYSASEVMALKVKVQKQSDVAMLLCSGQIVQGPESDRLYQLITHQNQREVVLDLDGVTALDEEGLFLLVLCYEVLTSANKRLILRNPPPKIMAALRRRQLDSVFGLKFQAASATIH